MQHQIGTDEAGYGPNYGPLIVAGTLWDTPATDACLYELLSSVVCASANLQSTARVLIADSKKVYGGSRKLQSLETPVLAILYCRHQRIPRNLHELAQWLLPQDDQQGLQQEVWLQGQELSLPVEADPDEIVNLGSEMLEELNRQGSRLNKVACEAIFASRFNREIDLHGNKATVLSATTLSIVRDLLNGTDSDVFVGCDKHGGRNRYGALIQELVTPEFVQTIAEARPRSEYQFTEEERIVNLSFSANGESFFPTAVASMIAKYMREIYMLLWNRFWQAKIPDLKPTQGYPQDAKRFRQDIATIQADLAIDEDSIWRFK